MDSNQTLVSVEEEKMPQPPIDPPDSYWVTHDEDGEPRGQGCMSDREYILFLEDAIMNASTGDDPCGFCSSNQYGKHTDECAYARIDGVHWMEKLPPLTIESTYPVLIAQMPVWASEDDN